MLRNYSCNICGRFFKSEYKAEYCPECKKVDDEMYSAVKKYLIERPKTTIFEISTVLNIPVKVLTRFVSEGRLDIVE